MNALSGLFGVGGSVHRAGVAMLVSAITMCVGGRAEGASITWTGAAASHLWSDGGNWTGGVPADGDDLLFGSSADAAPRDDVATLTLGSMTFAAGAPGYRIAISGGASAAKLELSGMGIVNQSGTAQSILVEAGPSNGTGLEARGGLLRFSGSATAGDAQVTNQGAGGSIPGGAERLRQQGRHRPRKRGNASTNTSSNLLTLTSCASGCAVGGEESRRRPDAENGAHRRTHQRLVNIATIRSLVW